MSKRALLLIDLQNDFFQFGTLEVKEAEAIIPIVNDLMPHFDEIVATKDWHPADHKSFAANHYWRKPGQVMEWKGLEQILWPIHCVQGSFGSEFVDALDQQPISKVICKGMNVDVDSYSAFYDNGRKEKTELEAYLKQKGIEVLYIAGVATDYCVKFSVLDALSLGFETYLITDACRGVNLVEGDVEKAFSEMEAQGAKLINSLAIKEKAI